MNRNGRGKHEPSKEIIKYKSHRLVFSTPNWLCKYRIDTFSTKEPETLLWLDSIPKGNVLWNIGANVRFYSIYAATIRNSIVYAFEPSVFNIKFFARNIFLVMARPQLFRINQHKVDVFHG